MLLCCCVFVMCLSLVRCGFVGVQRDHVVAADKSGKVDGDDFEANALEANPKPGDEKKLQRDLLSNPKDVVIPLLTGVIAKVLTLLPLILTTLAMIAGFSLAASKVALLLGGGLILYHYISENKLLSLDTKGGFYSGLPFHHPPPEHLTHPELPDFSRDRNLQLLRPTSRT